MAKVKLELKGKNPQQISDYAENIVSQCTGNTNVAALAAQVTALGTLQDQAQTAIDASVDADQNAAQKRQLRMAAVDALKAGVTSLAAAVEGVTQGDAAKIISTGFAIQGAPVPVGELVQVENLSVSVGDNYGELDLSWDPCAGRRTTRSKPRPRRRRAQLDAGRDLAAQQIQPRRD